MAITGTLCKLDTPDGVKEFLMVEHKGIPLLLGTSSAIPDYPEKLAFATNEAVKLLSDNEDITAVTVAGVGTISLAML